jgi:RNA polymerase sigma-70 factor (ECF subfamily)
MLNNRDTAGDITQEAFIRLYNNLNDNANIKNPKNWLFIITRNLCLNNLRDGRREISIDRSQNDEALVYNSRSSKYIQLRNALNKLDILHREALILKEYQGFTYEEIGKILNKSVSAVRSLLYKARVQLKENFEKINNRRL